MRIARHRLAFTFLEIMLVVLIIGILVSIVVPKFGGRSRQASIQATNMSIRGVTVAIDEFEIVYGRYPDDMEELVEPPEPSTGGDPQEFLDEIPRDAWRNDLVYSYPAELGGRRFDLYSMGPNEEDDRGDGDDITNWRRDEEEAL